MCGLWICIIRAFADAFRFCALLSCAQTLPPLPPRSRHSRYRHSERHSSICAAQFPHLTKRITSKIYAASAHTSTHGGSRLVRLLRTYYRTGSVWRSRRDHILNRANAANNLYLWIINTDFFMSFVMFVCLLDPLVDLFAGSYLFTSNTNTRNSVAFKQKKIKIMLRQYNN